MKLGEFVRLTRSSEKLPGGLGDNKPDSYFDPDQLEMGIKVEMEHTTDPELAREIAKDHLTEDPKYYTKLQQIDPHHGSVRRAAKDPKIEALKRRIEDLTQTAEQLKRRMEALTGPEVDPKTAEAVRTSIQRRIDAVN